MRDFSGEQVNHNQRTKECVGLILSFRSSHAGGDPRLEEAVPDLSPAKLISVPPGLREHSSIVCIP